MCNQCIVCAVLLLLGTPRAIAQTSPGTAGDSARTSCLISGRVVLGVTEEALSGAVVIARSAVVERQAITDASGFFQIDAIAPGRYRLIAEVTGATSATIEIDVGAIPASVVLRIDAGEVIALEGTSSEQRLRESAAPVKVIETETARRHTTDIGDVLARSEGVAVQRSGGLGSDSRLSIHGLIDDQIRLFLDGVPLEFSGFGLGIASAPLAWLDRIDVYRGVVPVRYGADALGGAIDLVTRPSDGRTSATASYAIGTFGTHQLAASARARGDRLGVANASAFFDLADNDYGVDVKVPDELGRPRPARVRRFHDGYRAIGGSVEAGVLDRSWAKRLLVRAFATDFAKQLQHNIDMSVPYGGVHHGQTASGATVRYEQPIAGGVHLAALLGYSHRRIDFEDTSRWVYDWFGNRIFERSMGAGELSSFATDLTQWENRGLARAELRYDLSGQQAVRLVAAPDLTYRTGVERLRINPDRIDPLTTRRSLFHLISGLEHELRLAGDRFENTTFAKSYLYRPSTDQVQTFDNSIRHVAASFHRFGAGTAARLRVAGGLIAKLSYELATRLPHADEVFGDGVLVLPNLDLVPETSHNTNLGALIERELGLGDISAELTAFHRHTRDMIIQMADDDRVHAIHQNVFTVRTLGADGALRWRSPGRRVTLGVNATFQDQRNVSDRGSFAAFDGERVPNRPWLFANASAEVRFPDVLADHELTLSWSTHYVRGFLPGWEEVATTDASNRIPSQLTHAVSAVYSLRGTWGVDLALDLANVTDERVYDVLGVQKPGRAAFLKATVCWDC